MTAITPASFFFLFNDGDYRELLETMRATPLFSWGEPMWWYDHPRVHGAYFDPGIAVMPATRVLAMSSAAKTAKNKFPIEASRVLPGCVPIGHFIAGLFAPCFVGDVRRPILQLATPPRLRGIDTPVDHRKAFRPKRIHTLKITKGRNQ